MPSLCQDSVSTGRVLRDSLLNQPVRLPKTRPLTARSFPSSLEELFKNYHHLRFAVVIHYAHRFYAQDSNRYIPRCMTSTSTICLLPPLSTFHLPPPSYSQTPHCRPAANKQFTNNLSTTLHWPFYLANPNLKLPTPSSHSLPSLLPILLPTSCLRLQKKILSIKATRQPFGNPGCALGKTIL
jgi:hypothetical protein